MPRTPPPFPQTVIRGMHYRGDHAKQFVATILEPGMKLELERDPDNEYDRNAIKVLVPSEEGESWHLGYVGAETAAWLAPWMDDGISYFFETEEIRQEKNNHYPVGTCRPTQPENT